MKTVRVFSRPGCHLCEQLIEELQPIVRGRLLLDVVDIDTRAAWQEAFATRIPVVVFEGRIVCEHRLDRAAIRMIVPSISGS